MGFFDSLFKGKKEEKQEAKLDLSSVEKTLKGKIEENKKSIEPELIEFHKKFLEFDKELKNSLNRLDVAVPKEKMDEKLLFAAQTGRPTFKNKVLKISEAIKKPVDFDFHSFSEYYNGCVFAVNQANALALTEFRTIGTVYEEEGDAVVNNIRRLKEFLEQCGSKIKKQQEMINPHEETLDDILELKKTVENVSAEEKRITEMKGKIEIKKENLEQMKKSVIELIDSEEWKKYENTISKGKEMKKTEMELRAQFNEMISSVERVMKKSIRVIDAKQEKDSKKRFERYLQNPFEIFLKDEDEKILTAFLMEIKKILQERKVDMNENVRRKSIEKIDEWIEEKAFKKIKEQYLETIRSLEELERIDEENKLPSRKSEIERKTSEIGNEISELEKRIENLGKQVEEGKKNVIEKKKDAEESLKSLSYNFQLEVNY